MNTRQQKNYDLIIEAGKTERHYWIDIWRYRELFYILAWRDIAVRYKQTFIGVLWAIIRPVLTTIIFVIVFNKIANLPSEGIPYPIFVFSALLPWTFFASAFSDASNSLIGNANLISKVYFPRLIIPAASIIIALVDFFISLTILLLLMSEYGFWPTWHLFFLPLFLLLAIFIVLGSGLLVASLNVKYRDFKFVIPFIIQIGLYISPVGFSTTIIPEQYQLLYYLNPMVAVLDGFRWSVTGGRTTLNIHEIAISINITLLLCLIGIIQFRKTEKTFADII